MNFLLLQVAHVAHPSRSEASSPLWEGMRWLRLWGRSLAIPFLGWAVRV